MQSNYKRWIVAALPLAMACTVSAQGKVTDVSTRQIDGGLAIHIGGSDLAKPATKWDGGALVLEFQADHGPKGAVLRPNTGGIKAVSFGKENHSFNVAIRPTGSKDPQIVKVSDGWLVYFEQGISDKANTYTPVSVMKAQQKVAVKQVPVNPRDFKPKAMVTLNFVATDVQQILKALSMQANVNVAMGPDVIGKITVDLDNVPVDEAMETVTTLGGVDFAYLNNTYIVASPAKFAAMVKRMNPRAAEAPQTRVVPLFSREGNQIKATILKMVAPSTVDGEYELLLPSEKLNVLSTQNVTPGGGAPTGGKDDKGPAGTETDTKMQQLSGADADKKDDYIVLIGTPDRMDDLEQKVRSLDEQICSTMGIKVGSSQAVVQRTYEPKGILAADLVKSILGNDKQFDGVQLVATPGASISKQTIVLSGREGDVDHVLEVLSSVDRTSGQQDYATEIVGLKYAQPSAVYGQLMDAVPGLKVIILPPPIDPDYGMKINQQLTTSGSGTNGSSAGSGDQASGSGGSGSSTNSGSSGGSSAGAQAGGASTGSAAGSSSSGSSSSGSGAAMNSGNPGYGNIKTSTMSNSIPMKLMLRGTADQIAAAKSYISMVDLAPKQVAVELRVMELSREDAEKFGLDWSVLTGGFLKSFELNEGIGDNSNPGGIKGGFNFARGGSGSVLGTLDALTTKNNTIARPSMLLNDGVPTNMFVGDEVRYVVSITAGTTTSTPTVQTGEVDTGVNFNITARVGDGGHITLDMNPTLEILQGFTPIPNGGSLPQTSRRSAQTQVTVNSGETLAIGGLIQDQDVKTMSGIPILRDLPIIGQFFRRTNNDKIRTEVVFFVTVKEVTQADRQGAANPNQAERDNKDWPGQKDNKRAHG